MESARRLCGREAEMEQLEDALGRAKDGHAVLVIVEGEAGIGKSALLEAMTATAADLGSTVLRAKAEELERSRPFAMVRQTLGAGHPAVSDIDALVAAPGPDGSRGWVEAPERRFLAVDRLVEAIEAVTADGPVVLALDDVQWADEASVHAFAMVLRRLADRPLLVAVARRSAAEEALLAPLMQLADPSDHLELRPLSESAVSELVRDELRAEPTAALLAEVARAGGNPFFVLAVVEAETDTTIADTGRLSVSDNGELPESVHRVVADQLARFDPVVREMVRRASVLGGSFSAALLAEVCGCSVGELTIAIETALAARLFVDDRGCLTFRHDLLREIVYATISPAVRSGLHREIGHQLLAADRPAAEVAHHFVRGAEPGDVEAVAVLRRAAADLGQIAPGAASELLEKAVSLVPEHHPARQPCQVELIQSYVFSAELERSSALAEELLAASLPADLELSLRNARTQVFFLQGHARRAAAEFEAMAPLVAGEPREAVLLADAAVSMLFAIDLDRSRDLAERSLNVAAKYDDHVAPALAHGVLAWMTALSGDLDGGVEQAEWALRSAGEEEGLAGHRRIPHLFHAQALLWADRVDEARSSLHRGRSLSASLGMGWDEPMYQALLADERIRAGEWDDALAEAEAGLARAREVGSYFADGWLHVHRARVVLARGDRDGADLALTEAEARLGAGGGQGVDQLWWQRGLLAEAAGDLDAALLIATMLWDKLDQLGTTLRQLEMAPDLVRIASGAGDREFAARIAATCEEVDRRRSTALSSAARGWVGALMSRDADDALDAVDRWIGRGHPVELARCRADAATALARAGRPEEAAELAEAAFAELDRLGATWLIRLHLGELAPPGAVGRSRPTEGWEALTPSEQRVVSLVGEGLTNAAIADRLNISRRTVESHLYHAYPKLGLSSRVELAVFAASVGERPAH